jgi:chromosome segregation ATPase
MMRRHAKTILMRIPAVRRYLEDKRSIAAALQASITERNHLVAEISYLRATGETLTAERNAARNEAEQIGATARFLGLARDVALQEVNQRQVELTRLVAELNELKEVGAALVNAAAERDRAIEEARQTHDAIERLLHDRDIRIEEINKLREAADATAADRVLCQDTIGDLQKAEAKLKLEIEILRASLARAIAENDRLRLAAAGRHPTRNTGSSR